MEGAKAKGWPRTNGWLKWLALVRKLLQTLPPDEVDSAMQAFSDRLLAVVVMASRTRQARHTCCAFDVLRRRHALDGLDDVYKRRRVWAHEDWSALLQELLEVAVGRRRGHPSRAAAPPLGRGGHGAARYSA